jgi:hypothetical protein
VQKYQPGEAVTRQLLCHELPLLGEREVDNFRLHLTKAGYWKLGGFKGQYVVDHVPAKDLRWKELIHQAYPDRGIRGVFGQRSSVVDKTV